MLYRLGLALGTNSIGWSAVELNHNGFPQTLRNAGARIFTDGRDTQTGTSLAALRTEKRGFRRQRDRFIFRRQELLGKLTAFGLLPESAAEQKALSALNPYQLRAEALDRPLSAHELGRTLVHLNQRRGFKSNRKQPQSDDDKSARQDIEALKEKLAVSGSRTLGEFLYKEWQKDHLNHAQRRNDKDSSPKGGGTTRARKGEGLYPLRKHYEDEFDAIAAAQKESTSLCEEDWAELRDIIFYQRDLAPKPRGHCQLMYKEGKECADAALPSAEMFAALQTLNNLGWREKGTAQGYTMLKEHPEKWQKLWEKLQGQKTAPTFNTAANAIGLVYNEIEFNLEKDDIRNKLKAMQSSAILSKYAYFSEAWQELSLKQKDDIVHTILNTADVDKLENIAKNSWGLDEEKAQAVARLDDSNFKSGTSRFCQQALHQMIPHLLEGKNYWDAANAIGYDPHGSLPKGAWAKLPYYGEALPDVAIHSGKNRGDQEEQEFGIIGNPTAHIALNQLRKVVNELIDLYGKPESVHVELAQELKMNAKQKARRNKAPRDSTKTNEGIALALDRIAHEHSIPLKNNYTNRLRYKLWEEQKDANDGTALCPFSGEVINIEKLFTDAVDIEHILPFSQTLDDSPANKVVTTREASRKKGNRSPFEAFGSAVGDYAYEAIITRTEGLPSNKRWRFDAEAIEYFKGDNTFLDRQLHDTQYLSRVTGRYLKCVCKNVVASPGWLTPKLRHYWGLDSIIDDATSENDRTDHRHHAIDAAVAALTDTHTLLYAARANKNLGIDHNRLIFPCPIDEDSLREQAKTVIGENLVVSHRPNHGTQGQLHKETNYGLLTPRTKWEHELYDEGYNAVFRKEVTDLTQKDIGLIRDPLLREDLQACTIDVSTKAELKNRLSFFVEQRQRKGLPIRSTRVLKKDNSIIPIKHTDSVGTEHVKHVAPGGIHHVAFWQLPEGAALRRDARERFIALKNGLVAESISVFDANQKKPEDDPRPHPAAKLLMRLHKGDTVQLEEGGELITAQIKRLMVAGEQILYTYNHASGQKPVGGSFSFNGIRTKKVRKLYVTPTGKILNARPGC